MGMLFAALRLRQMLSSAPLHEACAMPSRAFAIALRGGLFPVPIGVIHHHLYPVDYSPISCSAVRLSMLSGRATTAA